MKVNVGKLKAHLSQYLRDLENQSEPLEVCVHDKTVAYLSSAHPLQQRQEGLAAEALRLVGLETIPAKSPRAIPLDPPVVAGDNHTHIATVSRMRESKQW